ncbi:hypothetical protein [Mesorhizobium sp. L103C131B0]|uniref:hypothetical protein n=1 Tax=Mesorhizobium sp. L103C131B0 TaxID=1287089 RepID=UPI0018C8FB37|nr:hypothetical protein [Mesorhizobium sp. L103C131B0]
MSGTDKLVDGLCQLARRQGHLPALVMPYMRRLAAAPDLVAPAAEIKSIGMLLFCATPALKSHANPAPKSAHKYHWGTKMSGCGTLNPFACGTLPLAQWVSYGLRWLVDNYRPIFQLVKAPFDTVLQSLASFMTSAPPLLVIAVIILVAWQLASWRLAVVLGAILFFIGFIGVWTETMNTLSIVLTALIFASGSWRRAQNGSMPCCARSLTACRPFQRSCTSCL